MSGARDPKSLIERMESRVSELELKLGVGGLGMTAVAGDAIVHADVSSRLDGIIRSASSSFAATGSSNSKRTALHEDYLAIDRLLRELDVSSIAGPTATVATGCTVVGDDGSSGVVDAMTPLAYRRMEVLANAESMGRDLKIAARIRDLVTIGTKTTTTADGSSSSSSLSSSGVVNCPIVSSGRYDLPSDPDVIDRLDGLCFRVANLCGRVAAASRRADDMLNSYAGIVMALSEKMVLAEEQMNEI